MFVNVLKSTFLRQYRRPWAATTTTASLQARSLYHNSVALQNKSKVEEVSGTSSSGGVRTLTPEEEQEIVGRLKRQLDDQSTRLGTVPVFQRALQYGNSVAIKDQNGEFSYARLYLGAKRLAADITSICGEWWEMAHDFIESRGLLPVNDFSSSFHLSRNLRDSEGGCE